MVLSEEGEAGIRPWIGYLTFLQIGGSRGRDVSVARFKIKMARGHVALLLTLFAFCLRTCNAGGCLVGLIPDVFQTQIVLLETSTGIAHTLNSTGGISVKGINCLDTRSGFYYFLIRDATSHALVRVALSNGEIWRWAHERFQDLRALHYLGDAGMLPGGQKGVDQDGYNEARLVGTFSSPIANSAGTTLIPLSAIAQEDASSHVTASVPMHLWSIGTRELRIKYSSQDRACKQCLLHAATHAGF